MPALPTKEGFFWGRWHTPAPGTQDDGECCSPEEWLPCHVVMNCVDRNHPDHLMAFVPGVMALQPLNAFAWGGEIQRPDYAKADRIEPDDYWGFLATPVPVKAGLAKALEACRIIDEVIREGHDNYPDMVMHFLSAAEPARAALRAQSAPVVWLEALDDRALCEWIEARHSGAVRWADDPAGFHNQIEVTPPVLREIIAAFCAGPHGKGTALVEVGLREAIAEQVKKHGSQSAWAAHLGVSAAFVSAVISGSRPPSPMILADLGLERVTNYRTAIRASETGVM